MSHMKIFSTTVAEMKQARLNLGSPATLNEAITATGIDAFFVLLDGGTIELEGKTWVLRSVEEGET